MLAAACMFTYGFIAWVTPITYTTIESDKIAEKTDKLINDLENVKFEDGGEIIDKFIVENGCDVTVYDEKNNFVPLSTVKVVDSGVMWITVTSAEVQSGSLIMEAQRCLIMSISQLHQMCKHMWNQMWPQR